MNDPTAPARHDQLMADQINLPDLSLPAPMMPGCERIDVYLASRGWGHIRPRDIEVGDEVSLFGFYGWVLYNSPEGSSYWDAEPLGALMPNEKPVILSVDGEEELHIQVNNR